MVVHHREYHIFKILILRDVSVNPFSPANTKNGAPDTVVYKMLMSPRRSLSSMYSKVEFLAHGVNTLSYIPPFFSPRCLYQFTFPAMIIISSTTVPTVEIA